MEVGIVSMYPNIKHIYYVELAIKKLGYTPIILNLYKSTSKKIYEIIKRSKIVKWIFSGSPCCVIDRNSPQIPLQIFDLKNKEFMLICYSLQSAAFQMKYPISIRSELKKEKFLLDVDMNKTNDITLNFLFEGINSPIKLWRNHYGFVASNHIIQSKNEFIEIASYEGESMIVLYKNTILVQFHPERTRDGYTLINNWLQPYWYI